MRVPRLTPLACVLALLAATGCTDSGPSTAYCQPQDPLVTPRSIGPGGELRIEVAGLVDAGDCELDLPDGARYELGLTWDGAADEDGMPPSASLGTLDPGTDGAARGTARVPEDVPAGPAEVSVSLEGASTLCEIDPTIACAKEPFALVDITG